MLELLDLDQTGPTSIAKEGEASRRRWLRCSHDAGLTYTREYELH